MRRKREARPSRQARGRAQKSNDIVARNDDGAMVLLVAAFAAAMAFVAWCEAGPAPALAGTATAAAVVAVLKRGCR